MSYVTGSHSAKFGARFHQNDSTFPKNFYNNAQLKYNFRGGVPYQLTMYADQASDQHQQQHIFALYAQDRWTINRLSLQGGLRFEHLGDHFAEQQIPAEPLRARPAVTFAEQDGPLSLKDIQPRFGASYDVFGNGKTAAKVFVGPLRDDDQHRGRVAVLQPRGQRAIRHQHQPAVGRDSERRLRARLRPVESGGQRRVRRRCRIRISARRINPLTVDPDTTSGWNKREYSWDLTAGITQEVAPQGLGGSRLHQEDLGQPEDHHQPRLDAGRLRHVRLQRAAGPPAARRRRIRADVPRREARRSSASSTTSRRSRTTSAAPPTTTTAWTST